MPSQLVGHDGYIELLRGREDIPRCPTCGVPTHPFDHGFPNKDVPQRRDLISCFEGFQLASPRLKSFLEDHCSSPIEYHETGGGYYVLRPLWVRFEELSPGSNKPYEFHLPPTAEEFCGTCGRFNAFHATPTGILPGQHEIEEFDLVRSGLEYGPKMQKSFFLIAGDGLVQAMKVEGFNGATYVPYNWREAERPT